MASEKACRPSRSKLSRTPRHRVSEPRRGARRSADVRKRVTREIVKGWGRYSTSKILLARWQKMKLPIACPAPEPRETIYSYVSRLAATWNRSVTDLTYDMGASFRKFLEDDPAAIEALLEWTKLDPLQVEEMRSWTGVRAGNVRMRFRGELFVSRALRNPIVRGCPRCLRDDAAWRPSLGPAAMVMRGDWQFRECVMCVRHCHPLVALWTAERPQDRHDYVARLGEIAGDILSGALDRPKTSPSGYDRWLDGRLEDGRDETWFRGQPLVAATTFCRLLGLALLGERASDARIAGHPVHATGFEVASQGEAAIREALDRMVEAAPGHLSEPNDAFGALYTGLCHDYPKEDGFTPYAAILRDSILDHWPIAPGEVVLGTVVNERRLHSLVTAARETGVGASVLGHFLVEAGALPEQDDRPRARRTFDARSFAGLLAEIPTLVGPIAMRQAMGATRQELVALEEEGVLAPRTSVAKVKNPWRPSDGVALVDELRALAGPVAADDDGWETLLRARSRTRCRLADLILAVREGRLPVGRREGVPGFHGIVVPKDAVSRFVRAADAQQDGEAPFPVSAAVLGRSIGLRDGGFVGLIEAGYTPARQALNPRTGRLQYWVDAEDIAAFHRRFVTVTTLSAETGHHRNTVRSLLTASKISRFAPGGKDFGRVYLRSEAMRAF